MWQVLGSVLSNPIPHRKHEQGLFLNPFRPPWFSWTLKTPRKNPFVENHLHKNAPDLGLFLFLACI